MHHNVSNPLNNLYCVMSVDHMRANWDEYTTPLNLPVLSSQADDLTKTVSHWLLDMGIYELSTATVDDLMVILQVPLCQREHVGVLTHVIKVQCDVNYVKNKYRDCKQTVCAPNLLKCMIMSLCCFVDRAMLPKASNLHVPVRAQDIQSYDDVYDKAVALIQQGVV